MRTAPLFLLILALLGTQGWMLSLARPTPPPAPPSPPLPAGRKADEEAARHDRIKKRRMAEVERLRELRFTRPLPQEVQNRRELRAFLKKELDTEDWPKDEAVARHFGLVPPGYRLREGVEALYGEQIAGYYDPRTRKFVMVEDRRSLGGLALFALDPAGQIQEKEIMVLHEMDHALTDQHFDLQRAMDAAKKTGNGDFRLAVQSLVEGDATALMLDAYNERHGLPTGMPIDAGAMERMLLLVQFLPFVGGEIANAPLYLQKSMLFPYLGGAAFVSRLRMNNGWASVNGAFRDLPASTEQILHPEKYGMDEPVEVRFRRPAAIPGCRLVTEGTLGEFLIRLRAEVAGYPRVDSLAAGWGGDRYRIYERNGRTFSIWHTTWDTEDAAFDFYYGAPVFAGGLRISKRGHDVVILQGIPNEILADASAIAWDVTLSRH